VESGSAFDVVSFVGEGGASLADDVVEFVDGRDMFVDDGLVDQRPQRFGWLQFWRVGRQEDQPHAVWDMEPRFAMPAGVVENEHDGSASAGGGLARKGFEQRRKERLRHAVMHIPKGLAARWRDEGRHVKPIEAMMARRDRALADRRPNAPCYRLQAEPMFVARKDLDRPLGMLFRFLGDDVFEVFLNAAASSGVADLGFFGRGVWIDMPQAFSASQPR
jgi:hypothetical protein